MKKGKKIANTALTENVYKTKLLECTLEEYVLARYAYDRETSRNVHIKNTFGNVTYYTIELDNVMPYDHKKMQAVLHLFLRENGFVLDEHTKITDLNVGMPVMMDMYVSESETISIYKNAFLLLKKLDRLLCLEIEQNPRGDFCYKIYCYKEDVDFIRNWQKFANEKNIYKNKKIDCDGNFLKLENISWDDVVLDKGTKEVVQSNIGEMFALCSQFKKYNMSVKRGVILHGEPGTGKTKICKCLAKETSYSVLYALPSDFKNLSSIKHICDMAKDLAPCLLIIEDIDWIAQDRHKGAGPFVMELMNRIDGLETFGDIITLGTTNCVDELEEAVKNRPGRFDRLIKVGLPSLESIEKMIRVFTKNHILDDSIKIDVLVKCCEKLSGAHVYDLCNTAIINAIRDKSEQGDKLLLKNTHFLDAVNEIKNKNYSSYMEMQSKGKSFGFGNGAHPWDLDNFLDSQN